MNENPTSNLVPSLIMIALFFGGGFVGEQLAIVLAPGSDLSRFLGFLVLPFSFMLGIIAWAGTALIVLIKRLLKGEGPSSRKPREITPGEMAFLWSSVVFCGVVGASIGLLSKENGFVFVTISFIALGFAYGAMCWRLAKSGRLPFPRE